MINSIEVFLIKVLSTTLSWTLRSVMINGITVRGFLSAGLFFFLDKNLSPLLARDEAEFYFDAFQPENNLKASKDNFRKLKTGRAPFPVGSSDIKNY